MQESGVEARDRDLGRRVLETGDEAAFRELYRRHTPRLYQFVLRIVGGAEADAEDLVQETWLAAVNGLPAFRWESRFGTWLTGIGLNRARDHLRRRGVRLEEPVATPPELPVRPARTAERIDIDRAIAELAPGYRAVLVLHDIEGYTHAEIGERLGITAGTSKSQLSGARRVLRARLGWTGATAGSEI